MDFNRKFLRRLRPKEILRHLSNLLPESVKFDIYRNMVRVQNSLDPAITLSVAETKEDLEAAFKILHAEYVRSGFMEPHPSGLRVTPYHVLPSTSTLVAKWDGNVVATLSIIRDNAFGIPLDKIYDTTALRKHGARLAEISSLAIHHDFRQNSGQLLFPLLKFMYEYCMKYFGVDYLLIAVHPKHFPFYQSILFFEKLEEKIVENYAFVNGCPAAGGYLDLRMAYIRFASHYGRKPQNKNLFQYFTQLKLSNFSFPKRRYFKVSDPIMTPELLDYFFRKKTDVFAKLSEKEKAILSSLFIHEKYHSVLPETVTPEAQPPKRKQSRFEVRCAARIIISDQRTVTLTVKDVSLNGFQAYADKPLRFGLKTRINVAIADFEIADLVGWPTWKDEEEVYGFYIEEYSDNWKVFLEHLERDFRRETTDPKLVAAHLIQGVAK